jgi:hypothetical protein
MFFCGSCGAHGFRPPCKRLQEGCEGPARTTAQRRVLAQLRSGHHPDSRPPYYIGNPRPLFAHTRTFHDPFPMLPRSASGPAPTSAATRKRDLTPVPQPIDFLAAFSKPKIPRLRSPSPCPYARNSSPSIEGPVEQAPLSPSIEGSAPGCADSEILICIVCGSSFLPIRGEENYGQCMTCSDAAFHKLVLTLPFLQPSPPLGGPASGDLTQDGDIALIPTVVDVSPPLGGPGLGDLTQDIDGNVDGLFRGDLPSSPLPHALRFNYFTPNPSAPSPPSPNSNTFASLNSDEEGRRCISCNLFFTPRGGENCYGKCEACLNVTFHNFVRVHGLQHVHDSHLHVAQAGGPQVEAGDPSGDPSYQPSGANVGAVGPISGPFDNSVFLNLAPQVFCRICDVAFTPQRGVECDSLCEVCRALPPPKRLRITMNPHRKAGPPDDD